VTASSASNATRIVVVGAGHVGTTFAYSLLLSGLAAEIVLVDADHRRAEGEAMDLNHAVPFTRPARVWAGYPADCAGAAVTVIAAGVGQRPGETRLDLLRRNAAIFAHIVPAITAANPDGILLVATNPVDVLTDVALEHAGLPPERVIGSGTILDTARFRYLISRHVGVDPRSVHAHVIGEHGDSEVPIWSLANVAGMRLDAFCAAHDLEFDDGVRRRIATETREAAYAIIERKGATYYAVAAGLLRIVEAILRDQRTVLTVSTRLRGNFGIDDLSLSLPTVVDRSGAARVLRLDLDANEIEALHRSAEILRASGGPLRLPAKETEQQIKPS
jgi:L-lactate dehydrogenase